MKKVVILSLVLLIAISTQVEGKKKKWHGHPKSPPEGRHSNSSCFCKDQNALDPTPGHHHPSRPQSPSRRHGPQGHHPRGPHGPHGPHHNGQRGPHYRRHKKRHRGPHNRGPTGKQGWKKCACRKPDQFKIKFRMIKQWLQDLANSRSGAFRRLTYKITKMLAKVLNTREENINDMHFTEGSIVVEFEVKNSEGMKDPGNALKEAIHSGQLSDLQIQPESLTVHHSYSGVKLSEWKLTDESECDRCGSVTQTRECTEVTGSCDGIPLTRNASCYEACPASRIPTCRGFGRHHRMAKVMIIACFVIVTIIVIVAVMMIIKVKRARRKNLSTSPSTSSIKKLADDDKLEKEQSKC